MSVERQALGARLARDLIRWAPKRSWSTALGWLSRRTLPQGLRAPVYEAYARRFGVDLDEAALPLAEYDCLDAFFTRRLRDGARPVAPEAEVAVSPVDGEVLEHGVIDDGCLLQAKGRPYTVAALLGDAARAERYAGGVYVTLYLSPRDYHRIHAPVGGLIVGCRHVPGALFPVNARAVRDVDGLYTVNERLVTFIEGEAGEVAVVKVAACGVGHITATYDASVVTHVSVTRGEVCYEVPVPVRKGEEIGIFHLGSTVIVLFPPDRIELAPLRHGQRVLMGQPLGRLHPAAAVDVRGGPRGVRQLA